MDLLDIKLLLAEKLGDDCVIADAEMSSYCSFRCGGRADLLVTAENMDALRYILYVTAGAEVIFGGFAGGKDATFCSSGHCCEKECVLLVKRRNSTVGIKRALKVFHRKNMEYAVYARRRKRKRCRK